MNGHVQLYVWIWWCAFSCKLVKMKCKCASEMHKIVEVRKQVCLWNHHVWVRCELHMREWVLSLVCRYVMPMCRTKHVKKVREFVCNVSEPNTQGCNRAKQVCKKTMSFYPSTSSCGTSDGDLCIGFEHLRSVVFDI